MLDDRKPSFEPPSRMIPALASSLVFHALLFVGWFVFGWQGTPTLVSFAKLDPQIQSSTTLRLPDRGRYSKTTVTLNPSKPIPAIAGDATPPITAASVAPANFAPPIDLDNVLVGMLAGDVPTVTNRDLTNTTTAEVSASERASYLNLDAKPTTTLLFGISGSGSRFIYLFDRSDSMNGFGGRPLRAAKSELKRSLLGLSASQQFQIIFYNDEVKPYVPVGSGLTMLTGEKSMIGRASKYVDAIQAYGDTGHYSALRTALNMSPDVIFFLTDAGLPGLNRSQLSEVKRLADRTGTSIHTIEFGVNANAPGDSFLQQLASENNGEYRYFAIDQLAP